MAQAGTSAVCWHDGVRNESPTTSDSPELGGVRCTRTTVSAGRSLGWNSPAQDWLVESVVPRLVATLWEGHQGTVRCTDTKGSRFGTALVVQLEAQEKIAGLPEKELVERLLHPDQFPWPGTDNGAHTF